MGKVTLYPRVNGKKWEEGIAYLPGVRPVLKAKANEILLKAIGNAAAYNAEHQPDVPVRVKRSSGGKLDEDVVLIHPAAIFIEMGRKSYQRMDVTHDDNGVPTGFHYTKVGAVKPAFILRKAAGLGSKASAISKLEGWA